MSNILNNSEFDYLIFIGRFQPLHRGHEAVINAALQKAEKVIILVGSSNLSRSYYNPFTFEERQDLIENSFYEDRNRLIILPVEDWPYNNQIWVKTVQNQVKSVILTNFPGNSKNNTLHGLSSIKVGLIGCSKDQTSFYLSLFPQWPSVNVSLASNGLSASQIRENFFSGDPDLTWGDSSKLSIYVYRFLSSFKHSKEYNRLVEENTYVQMLKESWSCAPYPPVFVTVDAVVIQSGHVLLVTRKAKPGEGLLALPGGFIQNTEKLDDAVYRELKEETKIKVPEPVLRGSTVKKELFDSPHRSVRGRTITQAYLIKLQDREELPKVKGGDDASHAQWIPLAELNPKDIFEDHFFIIQKLVNEL